MLINKITENNIGPVCKKEVLFKDIKQDMIKGCTNYVFVWENNSKMLIFPKLIHLFNTIPIKFLAGIFFFFFELDSVIFKLHRRLSAKKRQENMKKNSEEGFALYIVEHITKPDNQNNMVIA